jgi:hypothetical protein
MSNNTIEVWIEIKNNIYKYKWKRFRGDEFQFDCYFYKKSIYRILLKDIYRDGIPIENIHLDENLVQGFELYKRNHQQQINQLKNLNPTDWSIEHPINTYNNSGIDVFDTDNEDTDADIREEPLL